MVTKVLKETCTAEILCHRWLERVVMEVKRLMGGTMRAARDGDGVMEEDCAAGGGYEEGGMEETTEIYIEKVSCP